jgi:4-amino-4-deoxy-L-arabinose transferase-like glycosyltransferase
MVPETAGRLGARIAAGIGILVACCALLLICLHLIRSKPWRAGDEPRREAPQTLMAENIAGERAELERIESSSLREFLTRRQTMASGLFAGFFLLTFAVYWYTGPENTPYVHHVNQANAFLHGRLDIDPEFTKNANLLERAFDDERLLDQVKEGVRPPDCGAFSEEIGKEVKCYLTHPPMPAIILLPLVAFSGLDVNQALVSAVLGALTAALVYRVTSTMTDSIRAQVLFTVLFAFGTVFWYTAAHGGVWFFSHTAAVLFLFLMIYGALVVKNPLLAGVGLGAAFLSRNPTAFAVIFPLIIFSDQWLRWSTDRPLTKRIDPKPLLLLAAGALPFVIFSFVFNYLRFETPLEAGYNNSEQIYQPHLQALYGEGLFKLEYVQRHIPIVFERMPIFKTDPPYVIPYGDGMAIWATTPAFLYGLFAGVRDRRLILVFGTLVAAAAFAIFWTAASQGWNVGSLEVDLTDSWLLVPFYAAIALGIWAAFWAAFKHGDRLALACWGAIVPIALTNFTFAAWGFTQFGYRYGLDFYPFLFLLTIKAMGKNPKWHHYAVVGLSVLINLCAVLWIYQFGPGMDRGWKWFEFF